MTDRININKRKQIILIYNEKNNQWLDATNEITAIYKAYSNGYFTGYNIYFGSNKYFYTKSKVRILNIKYQHMLNNNHVFVDNKLVDAIKVYEIDSGHYLVFTKDGIIQKRDVEIKRIQNVPAFKYFKKLASYATSISNDDEPLYILGRNYEKITVNEKSSLKSYLDGFYQELKDVNPIITPFDFNQSQLNAMVNTFKSNISVIEGPPGTGKTQTILNLIANVILRDKKVAVISNNNAAIENVYDKLKEEEIDFIAAKLGSASNVNEFFNSNDNSNIDESKLQHITVSSKLKSDIMYLHEEIKAIHNLEIDISKLKKEITHIKAEQIHFNKQNIEEIEINKKLTSNQYKSLIQRLENPKNINFFRNLLIKWQYKFNLRKFDLLVVIQTLELNFYRSKLIELNSQLTKLTQKLNELNNNNPISKIKNVSKKLFKATIAKHYLNQSFDEFTADNYKIKYDSFIRRFPVILSTTHSILYNIRENFLFDYLIIDEASQSDLLSSVISMNVSKNIVIVGDSKQLQQIDEERLFDESNKLIKEYNLNHAYAYHNNSILKSVKNAINNVPQTLLREHYRSAPDIIEFCNQMFYNNELISMTENSGTHINIIKTVPGNHARKNPHGSGMYNQREIDEINTLLENKDLNNIGVISPFRYQANLISDKFNETSLEADTVHKFQGRQKDEVILSFVVNNLDKDREIIENRIYDFINNKELLNVAISRAKSKVTVIVSDNVYNSKNNYIKDFINYAEYLYGSNTTKESTVVSVFDYLYDVYKKDRLKLIGNNSKKHQSELLMTNLIEEVLVNYPQINFTMHQRLSSLISNTKGFTVDEINYVMHPWTHVDFLFYNKVTKESLFVLEVDGIKYHEQNEKQLNKDDIKDKVLEHNNLLVHRFKTNEANEEARLVSILEEYNY